MSRKAKLYFVTLLTFARFPLMVLFFITAVINSLDKSTSLFVMSFSALVLAALTDLFDGYYARKFDVVTKFGAHADPLMDKFFYLATMPLLVYVSTKDSNDIHSLALLALTMLFLSRDQWVTFLRSIGAMYNVSGAANWAGKLRTGLTFPLICAIYYYEEAPESAQIVNAKLMYGFEIIAFIINIVSLVIYTKFYWPYLRRSAEME